LADIPKQPSYEKAWHVIYTTPRAEKKVNDRLLEVGIETYLPLIKTIRQWSDRKKKVEVPLFNSYLFLYLTEKERFTALQVPGVVRFLFYLGKPAIVKPREIDAIKRFLMETEGFKITVQKGDRVEIAAGVMEGVYGEVIWVGKNKLVLQIEQLGLVLTAEVEKSMIRKPR